VKQVKALSRNCHTSQTKDSRSQCRIIGSPQLSAVSLAAVSLCSELTLSVLGKIGPQKRHNVEDACGEGKGLVNPIPKKRAWLSSAVLSPSPLKCTR
jgi:hypothetical protein